MKMRDPGARDVSVALEQGEDGKMYIQFSKKRKSPVRSPYWGPPAAVDHKPSVPRAPVMDGDLPRGWFGKKEKDPHLP